jgi:hypothetical protein
MKAIMHCGKFAAKGSRPFASLRSSGYRGLGKAENKQFARGAVSLGCAVFRISSVPPSEYAIDY